MTVYVVTEHEADTANSPGDEFPVVVLAVCTTWTIAQAVVADASMRHYGQMPDDVDWEDEESERSWEIEEMPVTDVAPVVPTKADVEDQ